MLLQCCGNCTHQWWFSWFGRDHPFPKCFPRGWWRSSYHMGRRVQITWLFASSGCSYSFFLLANFVTVDFMGISVVNTRLDYLTLCLLNVCISSFVNDGILASNLMVVHNRLNLTNLTQKHEVPRELVREHQMETRGRPAPRGSKCLRTTETPPQSQRERQRTWRGRETGQAATGFKCNSKMWDVQMDAAHFGHQLLQLPPSS